VRHQPAFRGVLDVASEQDANVAVLQADDQ
jgi:hypothetical protein